MMKDFLDHTSKKQSVRVHHKKADQWLCGINQPSCGEDPFMFYTVDADTGYGLQGAEFALIKNLETVFKSYSNCTGAVWFPPLKEGVYQLVQIKNPEPYIPQKETYQVLVDYHGNISVDGVPACRFKAYQNRQQETASFTVIKYDVKSGARLQGAVFELCQDGIVIKTSISDADGFLSFDDLLPGKYQLIEKYPPQGYMRIADSHLVAIAQDGTVTINDHPVEYASIGNKPILYDVFFTKQDQQTGEPLQGAVFDLLDGTVVLYTAISNEKGEINFGSFAPGSYTLREQKPPMGYLANAHEYTVVVAQDGVVTIDGTPVERAKISDEKE